MRLRTIWTIPAMSPSERVAQTGDYVARKVAAHLPKRVKYWVFILVGSAAMDYNEDVTQARFMDLLDRVPGGRP